MRIALPLSIFLSLSLPSYAQKERVYLDVNRYSCRSGDTVWFKGYVLRGKSLSNLSTNLYVSILLENGALLKSYIFPLLHGQARGQVTFPDSLLTDNYYLLAFTKQQSNYDTTDRFSVPIFVYNKEQPSSAHLKKEALTSTPLASKTINGVHWTTSCFNGVLSSSLEMDTIIANRRFHLLKLISKDSLLFADVSLSSNSPSRYVQFPADTSADLQELLLLEDSTLIARQYIRSKPPNHSLRISTDTIDNSPLGYNSWKIIIPDTNFYCASISVLDADRSIPARSAIDGLSYSRTDDLTVYDAKIDTDYLSFLGVATRPSGKRIKDVFSQDIVIVGTKDSAPKFTKVVTIDSMGKFLIDSLFFFGDMNFQFQINKGEDGHTKDIKLNFQDLAVRLPTYPSFEGDWIDDTVITSRADTTFTSDDVKQQDMKRMLMLKPAIVKAWKNPRKELDSIYTIGAAFSEPTQYVYDLRTYYSKYNRDIMRYLAFQGGRLMYDVTTDTDYDPFGHTIHWFIDEKECDAAILKAVDFDRIAYVKILESDNLSTGRPTFSYEHVANSPLGIPVQQTPLNVCVYTRKGKDFRTMLGGLNKVTVHGYDEILKYDPDSLSLYWSPINYGNDFSVRFNNSDSTKRFRIRVEGVDNTGKTISFEGIIQPK